MINFTAFHSLYSRARWFRNLCVLGGILAITAFRMLPHLVHRDWLPSHETAFLQIDSYGYLALAKGMAMEVPFLNILNACSLNRTPLYPLFVAIVLRIFGSNLFWVILAQQLALATMVFPLYKLAYKMTGVQWIASLAAGIWVIDGSSYIYSNYLYTESLYVWTSFFSIYLFIGYLKKRKLGYLIGSGLLWGAATLVRPIGLYAPVIFCLVLLWDVKHSLKGRFRDMAIFMFSFELLVFPVLYHNKIVEGKFMLSNQLTLTTREMAISSAAYRMKISNLEAASKCCRQEGDEKRGIDIDAAARREIRAHKGIYMLLYAKGIGMLLFTPGSRDFCTLSGISSSHSVNTGRYENPSQSTLHAFIEMIRGASLAKSAYVFGYGAILLLMYGCIAIGLWMLKRGEFQFSPAAYGLLLLLTGYYTVIVGALGTTRYRMPMMPLLILLACPGLLKIASRLSTRHPRT